MHGILGTPSEPVKIAALNQKMRQALEQIWDRVWITGELSNLAAPRSGHLYFTLKDGAAQVQCVLFARNRQALNFNPQHGMQVIACGKVTMYEVRGQLQLIVAQLLPVGAGALQQAYEALKKKLLAQGLFDLQRKRPLPKMPQCIGVITSDTGAALRDVLKVLAGRFPQARVIIYPAQVQGSLALPSLLKALDQAMRRQECHVLMVVRGGGSLEDLWPFNEERWVQALAACTLPTISGVGHETDTTLTDFVVDVRAPTPSAAAMMVVPDQAVLRRQVSQARMQLEQGIQRYCAHYRLVVQARVGALVGVQSRVVRLQQRLEAAQYRLDRGWQGIVQSKRAHYQEVERDLSLVRLQSSVFVLRQQARELQGRLQAAWQHALVALNNQLQLQLHSLKQLNPQVPLSQGYVILEDEKGTWLRGKAMIKEQSSVQVVTADGSIKCKLDSSRESLEVVE
jgi:exodeoxyribonuclease VII large subunit